MLFYVSLNKLEFRRLRAETFLLLLEARPGFKPFHRGMPNAKRVEHQTEKRNFRLKNSFIMLSRAFSVHLA